MKYNIYDKQYKWFMRLTSYAVNSKICFGVIMSDNIMEWNRQKKKILKNVSDVSWSILAII